MSPRALGGLIAILVFGADQGVKTALLSRSSETWQDSTPLLPFLDLSLRWNRGISFSMFAQDTFAGRAVLIAFTLAAITALVWWLWRCGSTLAAVGLGAILGGAVGNAADRVTHGAVVDYLDLHAFGRHFFVFNLADAAINIGVALLVIDLIVGPRAQGDRDQAASRRGAN